MALQVAGLPNSSSTTHTHFLHCRNNNLKPPPSSTASYTTASLSSPPHTIQIVGGGRAPSWYENGGANVDGFREGEDDDWCDLDAELYHWTRQLRPVQWCPGHIAKTEKELKNELKLMDVVIEVGNARIPMSTSHPQEKSFGVEERRHHNHGRRELKYKLLLWLLRHAIKIRENETTFQCAVRRWGHFGKDLELLDSPGLLPMQISDQTAAVKLAICDDIGERSYGVADIAAVLVQMLSKLPSVGVKALNNRYKIDADGHCGLFRSLPFTCSMGIVIKRHFMCCQIFGKGSLVGLHSRGLPDDVLLGRLGGRQVVKPYRSLYICQKNPNC